MSLVIRCLRHRDASNRQRILVLALCSVFEVVTGKLSVLWATAPRPRYIVYLSVGVVIRSRGLSSWCAWPRDNRKGAATSSPCEPLIAHPLLHQLGGRPDGLLGAQAGAVIFGDAPGRHGAAGADGDGAVHASGHKLGREPRHDGGLQQDPSFPPAVRQEVRPWHRGHIDAQLAFVAAAPGKDPSVMRARQTVVQPARYLPDVVPGQALDDCGRADVHVVVAAADRDASLAEIVEAPGPDPSLRVEREAVVEPCKDLLNASPGQIQAARDQGIVLVALDKAAT